MSNTFEQIKQAIELIARPTWERGDVVELRALSTNKATVSGYFDAEHVTEMAEAAAEWSGKAMGVYITLNPVLSDCLARATNRAKTYVRSTTAKPPHHHHYQPRVVYVVPRCHRPRKVTRYPNRAIPRTQPRPMGVVHQRHVEPLVILNPYVK
jgi:hypothetical protein